MYSYLKRSIATLIRIYTMYEPMKVFTIIGSLGIFLGTIISVRFLYFLVIAEGKGHIQSLIFAAIFFIVGFQILVIGLLADIIAANRKLTENVLYRVKKMEIREEEEPSLDSDTM